MVQKKSTLALGCALLYGLSAFAQPEIGRQESWVDCPTPWGTGYHLVQPGENLHTIARSYDVSVQDLLLWNPQVQPDRLTVCQQLYVTDPLQGASAFPSGSLQAAKAAYAASSVPVAVQQGRHAGPDGALYAERTGSSGHLRRVHIVQIGERLPAIARAYGYTEAQLRKLNNMPASGDLLIFPGDVLYLDDHAPAPAIAAPPRVLLDGDMALAEPHQQVAKGGTAQVFQEVSVISAEPARALTAPVAAAVPAQESQSLQPFSATYFVEHVVRIGETLHAVAEKHQVTAEELALVNGLPLDAALVPGRVLQVPYH